MNNSHQLYQLNQLNEDKILFFSVYSRYFFDCINKHE